MNLEERARAWGVELGYLDAFGTWQDAPPDTVAAILEAMGADDDRPPAEGGQETAGAEPCLLPTGAPAWGWAAQLYAARSGRSWGIGDLGDLSELCRWSAEVGAGFVLVNPLHAAAPTFPQQPSPYFPISRRFRNPLYLRMEDVPGWASDLEPAAGAGRALNQHRLIDRDAVFRLKRAALERCRDRAGDDPSFGRWCRDQGEQLVNWGTYCALAERHGPDWRRWPSAYRRPDGPGADNFRGRYEDRVGLHQWLQWLLDRQLAAASAHLPLMHDLAVGFDPGGADAWQWQDLLAPDMAIGAPPDAFNTKGQVWGLPPFDPWKLRAAGYEPFVETVRASVRHAGALRIDHALGLARLYWVPEGAGPTEGAYVRYPFGDLLDVIARESRAAGAYVVAEDLGTSTPEILDALAARRLLSYRLLWFEEDPPEVYPVPGPTTPRARASGGGVGGGARAPAQDAGAQRDLARRRRRGRRPRRPGPGAVDARRRHPRRRPLREATRQHARHDAGVAELVGRPARPARGARGRPQAPSPGGDHAQVHIASLAC